MSGVVAQNVGRASGLVKTASGGGGIWTKIKTLTSGGSDDDLTFVDGTDDVVLDSTYPIYVFKFINLHPGNNNVFLGHQADEDGATSYAQTCTNSMFYSRHYEDDSLANLAIYSSDDQAQGTDINKMVQLGNDNDQCGSGYLQIFNPSSTTFVKHFISCFNGAHASDVSFQIFNGGYYNTTSALNTFQFKMSGGEIQGGKIKLYGLGDS